MLPLSHDCQKFTAPVDTFCCRIAGRLPDKRALFHFYLVCGQDFFHAPWSGRTNCWMLELIKHARSNILMFFKGYSKQLGSLQGPTVSAMQSVFSTRAFCIHLQFCGALSQLEQNFHLYKLCIYVYVYSHVHVPADTVLVFRPGYYL